jgi:uncharacterized membrane protein (DUF485 family)
MKVMKFAVIVLVALALRMAAALAFGGDPIANAIPYREIVAEYRVFPFALGILALAYGALLAVYLSFRARWRGRPIVTGVRFGAAFGLLSVVGMVEASLILGTSLMDELLFGLCEVPPLVAIGALGGLLFGPGKTVDSNADDARPSGAWRTALSIVIAILAVRYLSYAVIGVESGYLTLPLGTFVWTLFFGIVVGVLYIGFGRDLPGSPVVRGLLFGFIVVGIDWMLFTQVVPVLFFVSPFEWIRSYVVRIVMDCAAITVGVSVSSEGRPRDALPSMPKQSRGA